MQLTFVLLVGLVACIAPQVDANFTAPGNIVSNTTARSVYLTWDAVEGALGYRVRLVNPDTEVQMQAVDASGTEAAFAGLTPDTSYEIRIKASDLNETDGVDATHDFRTNLGEIEEITVFEATSGTIDIQWKPMENVASYEIRVTSDNDVPLEVDVSVDVSVDEDDHSMTSAFITGLETMMYYKVYVKVIGTDGRSSDETETRVRTDGSGVRITEWWESPEGALKGEAKIYRPLTIPPGLYRMRIFFPCPVQNWTFWNAFVNMTASIPDDGFFLLYQNVSWQWQKTEVGVIFNYGLEALTCTRVNENITVDFGDDLAPNEVSGRTDVEIERKEWASTARTAIDYAGMITLRLDRLYHGTNVNDEATNTTVNKPVAGSYVIALDAGEGCPGGLRLNGWWGMTLKDTVFLPEHKANVHYFAQTGTNGWTNNKPGLLYGYDPDICPSRDNITSYILKDSVFVDTVYQSYDYDSVQ